MKPGKGWSTWRALALLVLAGCATERLSIEKNLMAERNSVERNAGVSEHYLVACPDVLEVRLPHRPELSGKYTVNAEGRIDLGDYGQMRVDGRTLLEIAGLLATETGGRADQIEVRVAAFRSQYLLLFGEVIGSQRSVPYEGQETVLDLLQRVGGITPGAEPADVYVVRPHLGTSQRPEVFHVDLEAIVLHHDDQTNLRLLPFDQIYVGMTRQAELERLFPPWLRPLYQTFWDTRPRPRQPDTSKAPLRSRWIAGPRVGTAEFEGRTE
jgi:protein involved in polysaccharide export with SLBB domain